MDVPMPHSINTFILSPSRPSDQNARIDSMEAKFQERWPCNFFDWLGRWFMHFKFIDAQPQFCPTKCVNCLSLSRGLQVTYPWQPPKFWPWAAFISTITAQTSAPYLHTSLVRRRTLQVVKEAVQVWAKRSEQDIAGWRLFWTSQNRIGFCLQSKSRDLPDKEISKDFAPPKIGTSDFDSIYPSTNSRLLAVRTRDVATKFSKEDTPSSRT